MQEKYVDVHGFPMDADEKQCWVHALPNILTRPINSNIFVYVKHWPPNYKTYRKNGHVSSVNPPCVFSLPTSFQCQTTSTSRNVESRNVDAETRGVANKLRNKQPDPDLIVTWND